MTLKGPFAVFKILCNGFDLFSCYTEVFFLNIEF